MHLFRRHLDPSLATPRQANEHDFYAISRLMRASARRFIGLYSVDLPALLAGAPAMVLESGGEIWGAVVAGWPCEGITWLRTLVLANGLPIADGMGFLIPPFHALLRTEGLRQSFYAGDEAADTWLQPALCARGYTPDTDVIVYEKKSLLIPEQGNQAARVRRAESVDLPTLLEIDRACFEPQWHKDEGVLGPALISTPFFVVAELDGETVGYAFATNHFGGRLVHLVRIAVLPHFRQQAIGARLLAEVVSYARSLNAESVTLNTQAENSTAQRLYEGFGFYRTGERQRVLRFDL